MVRIDTLAQGKWFKHMNLSLAPESDGTSYVLMEIFDDIIQYYGNVHGGAIASLMDTCIGIAINQQINTDQWASTIEMKINYLRPANTGFLHGHGRVVQKGKNIIVANGEVKDDEGNLIAIGTATFMLMHLNT